MLSNVFEVTEMLKQANHIQEVGDDGGGYRFLLWLSGAEACSRPSVPLVLGKQKILVQSIFTATSIHIHEIFASS